MAQQAQLPSGNAQKPPALPASSTEPLGAPKLPATDLSLASSGAQGPAGGPAALPTRTAALGQPLFAPPTRITAISSPVGTGTNSGAPTSHHPPGPTLFAPAPTIVPASAAPGPSLFMPVAVSPPLFGGPAQTPLPGPPRGPALFTPGQGMGNVPLGLPPMGPSTGAPPLGPPPIGPPSGPMPLVSPASAASLMAPLAGPMLLSPGLAPPSLSPSTSAPPLGPPPIGGFTPSGPTILTPSAPNILTPSVGSRPLGPPPMGPSASPLGPPPIAQATAPIAQPQMSAQSKMVKVDPSAMPSPIALHTNRIVEYKTRSSGCPPPPGIVRFYTTDEGISSPHYMRFSMYQVPTTGSLANQSCIPFGAVLSPFAEDIYPENRPELVSDLKEKGPPRCVRCKAYPSPNWVWIDGGKSFRCNICDSVNDTPNEYYSPTDPSGLRIDLHLRPELRYGTIEFAVGPEYYHKKERQPAPLSMLFLIEVTAQAVRNGVLTSFCNALKALLPSIPPKTRLGIATFDSQVHYYALQKGQSQAHMLVMADSTAGFLPASSGVFMVPFDDDHRPLVESLLTKLPTMWNNNGTVSTATGAAIQSAILALRPTGGRIVLVQTSMPSLGAGALKARFDQKHLGTEKESLLFAPPEGVNFWADLGSKCSEMKICVDTILMTDAHIDLPTQNGLARSTCGQYFWLGPPKGSARDEIAFTGVLHRLMHRTTAHDALLRVRCSKGLTVNEFLCNHHQSAYQDEADLGGLDSDKTIAMTFKHEEELSEKKEASFQAALLYTTKEGERRVRVFNAALPTTTQLPLLFRLADMDVVLALITRQAVMTFLKEKNLTKVRQSISEVTVAVLASYRKYCSATSSSGQLILPEALKLIPPYVLGLMKQAAFRPAIDTLPDERFFWLNYMMNESPNVLMNLFYPRLYALHRIPPTCGISNEGGSVMLPPCLRLGQESIEPYGAYLVADDHKLVIWIARSASEELLKDAFGVSQVDQLDTRLHVLPEVDTDINKRIHAIIGELRRQRPGLFPSLHFVRQRDMTEGRLFNASLVEEKITAGDPFAYVDWLVYLHKEVMSKIQQYEFCSLSKRRSWRMLRGKPCNETLSTHPSFCSEQRAIANLENFNLFN